MARSPAHKGDITSIGRLIGRASSRDRRLSVHQQQLLADFCRRLEPLPEPKAVNPLPLPASDIKQMPAANDAGLTPRMQQTLNCLLAGDAEKQVARRLKVSQHTVHVYVKALYRHFECEQPARI